MPEPFTILMGVFTLIKTLTISCEKVLHLYKGFNQIKEATAIAVQDLLDEAISLKTIAKHHEEMLQLIRNDEVPLRRLCNRNIGNTYIKDLETSLEGARKLLITGVEILESLLTSGSEDLSPPTSATLEKLVPSPFKSNSTVNSLKDLTERIKKCHQECSVGFNKLWKLYQLVQRISIPPSNHPLRLTLNERIAPAGHLQDAERPPLPRLRTSSMPNASSVSLDISSSTASGTLVDHLQLHSKTWSKRDERRYAHIYHGIQAFSSPQHLSLNNLQLSNTALSRHLISQIITSVDNLIGTLKPHKRYSIISYTHKTLQALKYDIGWISDVIADAAQAEESIEGTWWYSDRWKAQIERLNVTLGEAKSVLELESSQDEMKHSGITGAIQALKLPDGSQITLTSLEIEVQDLNYVHLELTEWLKNVQEIRREDDSRRIKLLSPYTLSLQNDVLERDKSDCWKEFPFALSPANWAQISCTRLGDFNINDTRMQQQKDWMRDAGIRWVHEHSSTLFLNIPTQKNQFHHHLILLLRRFPLESFQSSIEDCLKQRMEEEPVHDILREHSNCVTECLIRLKGHVQNLIADLDEESNNESSVIDGGLLGLVDTSTNRAQASLTTTFTSLLKEINEIAKEHERMLSVARRNETNLQTEMVEFDRTDIGIHLYLQSWTTSVCVQGLDDYFGRLRSEFEASLARVDRAINAYITGLMKHVPVDQPSVRLGISPLSTTRPDRFTTSTKNDDHAQRTAFFGPNISLRSDDGVLVVLLQGETKTFLQIALGMAAKARQMPSRTFKNRLASVEYILSAEIQEEIIQELDELSTYISESPPDERELESEVERAIRSTLSLKSDFTSEQHTFSPLGSHKEKYYNHVVIPWSAELRDGGKRLLLKALADGRTATETGVKRVLERAKRKFEEDEALRNSFNERAINQLVAFCSNLWATEAALTEMESMEQGISI